MKRMLFYDPAEGMKEDIHPKQFKKFLGKDGFFIWVDFEAPSEEDFSLLAEGFNFHPLAIEDSKTKFNLPKIDDYKEYLFIVWCDLLDISDTDRMETAEVDVFLGKNFLVTIHDKKVKSIDSVYVRCKKTPDFMGGGIEWVLHDILDRMVDGDFLLVDRISDEVDELEDKIFEASTKEDPKKLFLYKRQLLNIRKIIAPQREVINSLIRHELFIERRAYIYFQDITDHLIRIIDFVDTARDVISTAMDIYLSTISNRLNELMKKLTIVATIFMSLTLITGIYGMNFENMPELYWEYGYFIVLLIMMFFAVGIFTYFKFKQWW